MTLPFLYISETEHKGRGVFTQEAISAETVIEVAPVIAMSAQDRLLLDKTLLHDYIFEWQPDGAPMCCMALGWVPIYNHSKDPNCDYCMDYEAKTIMIMAIRPIAAGDELTINYNGDNQEPVIWFDEKN